MRLITLLLVTLSGCAQYKEPIVITKGGTYTGNYKSDDSQVPAIRIETYEPVEITGCNIVHSGIGIQCVGGTKLTVHHNNFRGQRPNRGAQWGRALDDYHPQYLVFENNTINHTGGVHIDHSDENTKSIIIRYNIIRNTDKRRGDNTIGPEHRAGVLLNTLDHQNGVTGEIAWNLFENLPDSSFIEDNINLGNVVGDKTKPLQVHDNYIRGAYPYPSSVTDQFTGSGITVEGDPAHNTVGNVSQYINIYNNQVISTCNAGINVNAGHDISVTGNTIISAGKYPDGSAGGFWWAGGAVWNGSKVGPDVFRDITYKNNTIGYVHPGTNKPFPGRQDISEGVDLKNNHSLPNPITLKMEEAELPKFEAKLRAATLTIGSGLAAVVEDE